MSEIGKEEFIQRFIRRVMDRCDPRTHFDDGESIADYAWQTAPSYWDDEWQRKEGPEECADADMSYWGE